MRCAACGRDLLPESRFCMACGAEVSVAPAQVRKTVTIVFSDVAGSTALADALDPETVRRVMGRYFDACRSVLEAHGGTVEKFIGDAVMAVFGVPVVHEDDAMRAVRAAHGIRLALASLNETFDRDHGVRVVVRTGINTGEVMAGDPGAGQAFVSGDAVNVAARLEQAAGNDEILISDVTRQLVRDSVTVEPTEPLALKGKPESITAFRLVAIDPGGEGLHRRRDLGLVGRNDQLAELQRAFDHAVSERRCFLVTVIGEPGVGKSRLVEAFTGGLSDRATVLHGRCLSYGEGITFFPAAEIVAQAIGSTAEDGPNEIAARIEALIEKDEDAPLVATRLLRMLGLASKESQGATEEIYWAVRKLLESLASREAVVAVVDDIHWAEPALLDLLEHVGDLSREAEVLLICMARPDIFDERPGWGVGRANASSIVLEPLEDYESRMLAGQLIDATPLPPALVDRILEAADGNPLFMEQVVAHLVDQGVSGSVRPADAGEFSIPGSLTALLEARLDQLSELQRAVLQRGSIEGQVFHRGGVSTLLPPELRPDVAASFGPLMQKEFIASGEAELAGEDAFRFRHALIKDAAYRALPKETRAALHERLADWLEEAAGRRLSEFEEIIGHHLETAYRYRVELGDGDLSYELRGRAAKHLTVAGEFATRRGDVRAAASILERALALTDPGSPDRTPLTLLFAEVAEAAGRTDASREAWGELDEILEHTMDDRLRALIELQRLDAFVGHDEQGDWTATVEAVTNRAIAIFEAVGDHAGLARSYFMQGHGLWSGFRVAAASGSWELAALHAGVAGDAVREARALSWIASTELFGSRPANEAAERLRTLRRQVAGSASAECTVAGALAACLALGGNDRDARTVLAEALDGWQQYGLEADLTHYGCQFIAFVKRCAGEREAELGAWLDAFEASRRLDQENRFLASMGALLFALRGEIARAESLLGVATRDDWRNNLHMWTLLSQASAVVEARRGNAAEARRHAREACDLIVQTEFLTVAGDTSMTSALVERLLGDDEASDAAVERAIELYGAKGAVALIPPARSFQQDRSASVL